MLRRVAAVTVAAKPWLAHARVLARSFRAHHPEVPFFTLLADEVDGCFDPLAEPYRLLTLPELSIADVERLRFCHAQQPLSYAVTPFAIGHLLAEGYDAVLFLKQESLVVGDLTPAYDLLEKHPLLLTPHLLSPLDGEDAAARELAVLRSGACNVGFLGVAAGEVADRFLAWWQARLAEHCRLALEEGLHFEQRWVDLVPAFFPESHLLRDPGFNVGHWNVRERPLTRRTDRAGAEGWTVSGLPCRLVRFSGFEPGTGRLSRHSTLTLEGSGEAAALFVAYSEALASEGHEEARRWPYAWERFDNGVVVPEVARRIYANLGESTARFGDPLRTGGPQSFFAWLRGPADPDQAALPVVSRLWMEVHRQRPDVQRAFPAPLGPDREAFLAWAATHGIAEHGITGALAAPAADRESP